MSDYDDDGQDYYDDFNNYQLDNEYSENDNSPDTQPNGFSYLDDEPSETSMDRKRRHQVDRQIRKQLKRSAIEENNDNYNEIVRTETMKRVPDTRYPLFEREINLYHTGLDNTSYDHLLDTVQSNKWYSPFQVAWTLIWDGFFSWIFSSLYNAIRRTRPIRVLKNTLLFILRPIVNSSQYILYNLIDLFKLFERLVRYSMISFKCNLQFYTKEIFHFATYHPLGHVIIFSWFLWVAYGDEIKSYYRLWFD